MSAFVHPRTFVLSESRGYTHVYWEPLEKPKGPLMEFRLIYRGQLPAESSSPRVKEKHAIRRALHPQLKELWGQYKFLSDNVEFFAKNWNRCGFRFVPLLTEDNIETCSIDILFLRRDHPGNIIRSGGDIDNRLKVLFDGMRIAENCNQLGGAVPEEGEDPFFCLLQDDSLITQVSVNTDRLLTPPRADEHLHEVELVIHVKAHVAGIDSDDGFVTRNGKIISY
jgi:hypothetical protein